MRRAVNDKTVQIKERISLYDALSMYGINLNRRGFAMCPFHKEDTPSLGIFADGRAFNCFGCGAKGDVISFTMKLFNISFNQAIVRLDSDFSLGLVGQKPNPIVLQKYLDKKDFEAWEKWFRSEQYLHIQSKFKWCRKVLREQKPAEPGEPLSKNFVEALHKIEWYEYWLEQNR